MADRGFTLPVYTGDVLRTKMPIGTAVRSVPEKPLQYCQHRFSGYHLPCRTAGNCKTRFPHPVFQGMNFKFFRTFSSRLPISNTAVSRWQTGLSECSEPFVFTPLPGASKSFFYIFKAKNCC
jgi:hypothetical protein